MKTNYLSLIKSVFKNNVFLFFSMVFLSTSVLISCKKEKAVVAAPSFKIVGNPTVLSVDLDESTTTYEVLSNRPWKVVAVETGDWAKASPSEGVNNGKFKIVVQKNKGFEKRVMSFAFVVDGKEELVKLRVEQSSLEASLKVPAAAAGLSVKTEGEKVSIGVEGNVEWKYTIETGSWLTEETKTATQLGLVASANVSAEVRKATVIITSESLPGFSAKVVITQAAPTSTGDPVDTGNVKGGDFGPGSEKFWTFVKLHKEDEPVEPTIMKIEDGKLVFTVPSPGATVYSGHALAYQAIELKEGIAYKLNGKMTNVKASIAEFSISFGTKEPKPFQGYGTGNPSIYFEDWDGKGKLAKSFDGNLTDVGGALNDIATDGTFTVTKTGTYYLVIKTQYWGNIGKITIDNLSVTEK